MKLDLRLLRYFVVVAEQRHFGRAAEILNMAQPPLSQQIKGLEEELHVNLLDRSSRPVSLTPAGEILLSEAKKILAQVEYAQEITKRAGNEDEGMFAIGVTGSAALEFAAVMLKAFRERYPHVIVSLREMPSPLQIEALEKGEINLAFVRPPVVSEGMNIRLVHRENMIIALPEIHPLASLPAIPLHKLNGTPLVVFNDKEAPGFRELILHMCRGAGYQPSVIQEGYQMTTMLTLVSAGFGAAIIPQSARRLLVPGVVFRPVDTFVTQAELYAAWLPGKKTKLIEDILSFTSSS